MEGGKIDICKENYKKRTAQKNGTGGPKDWCNNG